MNAFRSPSVRRWLAAAALPLVLITNLHAGGIEKNTKDRVLDRMGTIITRYAYVPGVDFSKKWPEFLAEQKKEIDAANSDESFRDAVNGALSKFGFSHIVLQTPVAAKQRLDGKTVGIGVNLLPQDDGYLVIRVIPKSPADEGHIVPGDTIVEVNGKPLKEYADLVGEEGQPIKLKLKSEDGKLRDVKLIRRQFSIVRPEELSWIDKETAMITVHTFDLSYDPDRVEDLMKQAATAKKLVVDLRSNGGGVVLNVQHFLGLLLPPGTSAGTMINKRLVEEFAAENNGKSDDLAAIANWSKDKLRVARNDIPYYKGKIAVLVNGGTGSGAEIAAATLREQVNANVIGTKSAGAVLVALMAPLPEGWALFYPVTDYVTPKGFRIEGHGVKPDLEVNDPKIPLPGRPDEVVDKAVAVLNGTITLDKVGSN